jgi:hypothetical protein
MYREEKKKKKKTALCRSAQDESAKMKKCDKSQMRCAAHLTI